jgi:hypothetical protein
MRIPHGTWQEQFAEMRQIFEFFEILRVRQRTYKIDAFNRKLTGRKIGKVGRRPRSAFERNVPAQSQNPFRGRAIWSLAKRGYRKENARNYRRSQHSLLLIML